MLDSQAMTFFLLDLNHILRGTGILPVLAWAGDAHATKTKCARSRRTLKRRPWSSALQQIREKEKYASKEKLVLGTGNDILVPHYT